MPRGFRSRGCKGQSPLHKKTKNLPLPAGKGVGGMGERKQAKGRVDRRQRGQAPRRVPQRQGKPTTSPPLCAPAGTANARRASAARVQVAGMQGAKPLAYKKTKNLPLPRRGRGAGGWGQKIYDMAGKTGEAGHSPPAGTRLAGLTGGKEGKPPAGNMGGRASRQPAPRAPPQAPLTPAEPMPRGFRSRGCKGRSPLHKKTKNLPLPVGKGAGGMGAENL